MSPRDKKDDAPQSFWDFDLKMDTYNTEAQPVTDKTFANHLESPQPCIEPENPENPKNPSANIAPAAQSFQSVTESRTAFVSPLNHKEQRIISRGQKKIEARLDLHQMTQKHAFESTRQFIEQSCLRNKRMTLIITGKGEGVLRNALPGWLESAALKDKILYHSEAAPKDGGAGARYVYLRKNA